MDASVPHIPPHTREEDLYLLPRPPEPALAYGSREKGESQGRECVSYVLLAPDALFPVLAAVQQQPLPSGIIASDLGRKSEKLTYRFACISCPGATGSWATFPSRLRRPRNQRRLVASRSRMPNLSFARCL